MTEAFSLRGKISVEGKEEAKKDVNEVSEEAEKSSKRFEGALDKIGGAALKIGKVVGVGLTTVATGIGAMTKSAVESYANYEQLVGGVETLFGASGMTLTEYADSVGKTVAEAVDEYNALVEAQELVMKDSREAFRTTGLSANEYMETVTSFSAALISSLDGDTKAAAEKSNKAIVDMSDNANKMGSSMESIQNAYNGFAKQNYTMLDNLKLGYGGTKEEMARLLADASKLAGTKFDISSYADVVDAIHVIQTEMGITGTTSKEASTTIQGSVGMMKAAWTNFLTGMADPEQNFEELLNNLVDSVVTVAKNIAPRLVETVPRLVEGLMGVVEAITPYIQPMLEELLPSLMEGAGKLIVALVTNLPQLIGILANALWDGLKSMFQSIGNILPESAMDSLSGIGEAFAGVWDACKVVWESIGAPIWDAIKYAVDLIKGAFDENMPAIQETFGALTEGISVFWEEHLKPVFEAIGTFLNTVLKPVFKNVFEGVILPTVKIVFGTIGTVWNDVLKPVFVAICDFLTGVFTGDWSLAFDGIVGIVKTAVNLIIGGMEWMVNKAIDSINFILSGISTIASAVGKLIGLDPISLQLNYVTLPKLAKGGVLEKGQMGFLEGDGAEAVVPLDQNEKWIASVSKEMNVQGIGGGKESIDLLREILDRIEDISETMPETMLETIAGGLRFQVNDREFGRMVRAVT